MWKVPSATRQRCRVHFTRNALAHAGKSGRRVASSFIATAFAQDTAEAESAQWRNVADQIRPKMPKLASLMGSAEQDVLAYMNFPGSTGPSFIRHTRSNASRARPGGVLRSSESFQTTMPSFVSSTHLLLEQNDERGVQRSRH